MIGRSIGGAAAGGGLLALSIAALISTIGGGSDIPVLGARIVRLDLLATRDLEVNGDLPAGGASDNKPLVSDQTWTRTGGESCYPISSTDASCFAASEVPYTVDATGTGWVVEPDATNRILYSALAGGIDCTNWNCAGTGDATYTQTAPDGSATATIVSVGVLADGNYINTLASGYGELAALHHRIWVKCSAGNLRITNAQAANSGVWTIDCTVVAGVWALLAATHATVTETSSWVAASGVAGVVSYVVSSVSGTVTASIWAPTLTEEPGTGLAVIPTGASAVSTGDPVWAIANGGTYWRSGDTVTQTISEISGTCFVADATTITLTGAAGSECSGVWYGLTISR